MLDITRLRTLRAVAAHGSITGAAESLHLTTSAVSQQMSKLEREIGCTLLEPLGRGIRLTELAERLAEHADLILAQLERASAVVEQQHDTVSGRITIAAFATATRAIVAPALAGVTVEFPDVAVNVREMEPLLAMPLVERGQIDLAIVDTWTGTPPHLSDRLTSSRLVDDAADLAIHTEHRLARRSVVALTDVAVDQPWISWPQGSHCHDWMVLTLQDAGVQPIVAHTALEHSTQLALVASGLGIAVIPRLGRGEVPRDVVMVPLEPAPVRTIHAVWRRDASRRPSIAVTVDALKRHAESPSDA